MKRFGLSLLFFLCTTLIFAAAPSPTVTPKTKITPTTAIDSKIEDLKERLATKVAELRKTTPKAITGVVSQVSVSTVTIDTNDGKAVKIEITDDIKVAQVLKGKKTALTVDDISKNDRVTIFGDYDETLDLLHAKYVFIEAAKLPTRIHGFITSLDKKNNTIAIRGLDNATYEIDVETTTKTLSWTVGKNIEKSGFSKLENGMFVSVLGNEDATGETYSALRVLYLTPPGAVSPTPTMEATPSATPKAKVTPTPTKRVTPSVTPKA